MSARQQLLDRVGAWFAANGVGDTSLRSLGTGLGTGHRMLIYHFGSRDGPLFELALTGDRAAVDAAVADFADRMAAASR